MASDMQKVSDNLSLLYSHINKKDTPQMKHFRAAGGEIEIDNGTVTATGNDAGMYADDGVFISGGETTIVGGPFSIFLHGDRRNRDTRVRYIILLRHEEQYTVLHNK